MPKLRNLSKMANLDEDNLYKMKTIITILIGLMSSNAHSHSHLLINGLDYFQTSDSRVVLIDIASIYWDTNTVTILNERSRSAVPSGTEKVVKSMKSFLGFRVPFS